VFDGADINKWTYYVDALSYGSYHTLSLTLKG
jgi:hypothetical protein